MSAARITSFSAVPTMLQMMCEHPSWESADLEPASLVQYGGSPVQERVARAWLDRGVRLLQGYGMTEAAPGVYMSTHDGTLEHPTAVGVLTSSLTSRTCVRGGDPGRRRARRAGGPRAPRVQGLTGTGEDTEASFVHGRWFRTGDVLRVDDDGWRHVVDRVKDMYISGGENVYPAEVEAVAVQLDAVANCAVVGVPDPRWGEVGVGYVQLREAPRSARSSAPYEQPAHADPKYLEFVPELPRNATGKIRRRAAPPGWTSTRTPRSSPRPGRAS